MNMGQDRQIRYNVIQNIGNPNGLIVVPGIANQNPNPNRNGNIVAARAEDNAIRNNEEAGIHIQAEEFEFIGCCRQASSSGTQIDKAPFYDSDGSAEVHEYDNCYNNEIFNMFTQKEQYTELLEPIPEPHQAQLNNSNVISVASSVKQSGGTVEQHPATIEETRAYFESLYNNLAIEVEKVNSFNRKMKETNAELTTKLARYKNQEKCFEINQEKYDKLKRCYQKSVYQENCLTKKINALHLSSAKMITTLNEEIANLNNQLLKEKSTVSSLQEEKKNDTSPSVALKFRNEVKSTIMTLQRVVKQKMTLDIHNWSSTAHQEIHKIVKDEILPIVNQVDARVQNFKIKFLKEATKFVRDFKSLAKEADESLAKHNTLEFEIKHLLRAVVSQDIMSIVQSNSVVDTSNLQTELDPYNDMQQKIERLQAQLGDQKGKSKDTPCVSDTFDSLSQKLEYKNLELEFQVSEQKDTTKGTSANTKFSNQSTSGTKLYFVTPFPNSKAIPKNDLSKPVTSNSVPTTTESKVMTKYKVIAPRMFRIIQFKTSREDKFIPINKVRASVKINSITVLQPHVITKKHVNSDSNGLFSIGVDNTTKTIRPQPRSNTKHDRVPSASKSSYIKNKEVEVEEHHRNLLLSMNKKHISSECNNVKLVIRNDKSKVLCAINKSTVMKPKKVESKERLASPKPRKPRTCLRWSPTGRMFDLKGKIIISNKSESQFDCSKGDNACTSNP
ncbi:hypothetical protein Tco_1219668 [Tanacetum coccineum]